MLLMYTDYPQNVIDLGSPQQKDNICTMDLCTMD